MLILLLMLLHTIKGRHEGKYYSADTGEEGKKGKINFRPGIEPGHRDWETGTLGTRPLPRTKVYLPILSYVLPVVVGKSANLTLADPPNLVLVSFLSFLLRLCQQSNSYDTISR